MQRPDTLWQLARSDSCSTPDLNAISRSSRPFDDKFRHPMVAMHFHDLWVWPRSDQTRLLRGLLPPVARAGVIVCLGHWAPDAALFWLSLCARSNEFWLADTVLDLGLEK